MFKLPGLVVHKHKKRTVPNNIQKHLNTFYSSNNENEYVTQREIMTPISEMKLGYFQEHYLLAF